MAHGFGARRTVQEVDMEERSREERTRLRGVAQDHERLGTMEFAALLELVERCEAAGLVHSAIDVCHHALSRQPGHVKAMAHLVDLLDETGDSKGSRRLRRDLVLADDGGAHTQGASRDDLPDPTPTTGKHAHADLVRFVELFSGREGVHARQWYNPRSRRGGYSPVHEPLTPEVARLHLEGRCTVGAYLVRHDDHVRHVVLDLDVGRKVMEDCRGDRQATAAVRRSLEDAGRALCDLLERQEIPFLFEDSGYKGRHCWIFLDRPVAAHTALELGRGLVRAYGPLARSLHLESFPKQGRVRSGGLGNLVKLPLGVHLVSRRRSTLLVPGSEEVIVDPFAALTRLAWLEARRIPELLSRLPAGEVVRACDDETTRSPAHARREHSDEAVTPPFTERDLWSHPELGALLRGCAVLRRLAARAIADGWLDHASQVVLRHTLGHLQDGPRAVNFLFERCRSIPADAKMGRPLRGSPSSCATIRRRVAGVARRVGCACEFGPAPHPTTYPNPLLHVVDPACAVRLLARPGSRREEANGGAARRP